MQRSALLFPIFFLCLFFFSFLGFQSESWAANDYVIGLGESLRIKAKPGARVHISDGGIVRSRVIGQEIVMTGKRTGRTSIRFLGGKSSEDRTVYVTEKKIAFAVRSFQEKLSTRRGLRIQYGALPELVVEGELLRLEDWSDLVETARVLKTPWRLEASVFPALRAALRTRIESELDRLGWPGQSLDVGARGLKLIGSTESSALSADQKKSVTSLGLHLETSPGITDLEPMVRTRIVLAEVRRAKIRSMGIRWPTSAEASLLPSLQFPTGALTATLEALEEEGEGRILAMPTLLCRSGGEAKFLAGGEIPIKISTTRMSHVEWKKYGIQLHVKPKADRLKRMKFTLSTEISTLDGASAADGVPGLLTNRIETQFNLQGSQTIVLSGLIKREEASSASGIPILRSVPILGSLFDSANFRKHVTELIVFVMPEVVSP